MDSKQPIEQRKRVPIRRLFAGLGALSIAVAILGGMFAGMSAFTFTYGEGTSYFSDDPRSCINCHVMEDHFDSWLASSHAHVASCTDCHMPSETIHGFIAKADNGFFHSWEFTFQTFHEPIRIKPRNARIVQNSCLDCHSDFVHEMKPIERGGEMMSCVHCHAEVGHAGSRRR
ncbi:cytochrome c nitrite reductase small subunit [Phycisphaerales bacterium AB-hyl4]|uniref:Cytochrome c nitrite reductase small subunit n=1 Tax=Natronomicrosphaera hydrolytica TaxID=3242702 RepID=A0ABV4U450_9BACT